jgi:myosin heavy subunit
VDQLAALSARAERQLAQANQEVKTRVGELENKIKEAHDQLAHRAHKIQELEAALEALYSGKSRMEKEHASKLSSLASRSDEAAARLAAAMKERKDLEGRHLKELEDLAGKHKADLERRDSVRLQEVARLQQAVQEKSKALKVVELELARHRTKGTGSAPSKPAAASIPARPIPPSTAQAPPKTPLSVKSFPGHGQVATGDSHAVSTSSPKTPPPRPAGISSSAKPAAATSVGQAIGDRDRVVLPPADPESDDDWNALVDELDK